MPRFQPSPTRKGPAHPVDYSGMNSPDLERLRFLLRSLREPAPAKEAEQRVLQAFGRLWAAGSGSLSTVGWERRSRPNRRRRDRRQRAVLVETDRRSGLDRRSGDKRKS
jgi:hypothetical protein